jgi:NADH:ubiquinone oxidoreductase subunit D
MALELAAVTPFLYLLEARELMCDLLDALRRARHHNYIRIGGVSADLPRGFDRFSAERLDRSLVLSATPNDCHKIGVSRSRRGTGHWRPKR